MNSYANNTRKLLATCCGAALAMGVFAFSAQADPWDKKTTLTVDKTIQVTDRVLPAGTYVFKLASSDSNRHIVQIFDKDQRHIIDTILAIPNYRLRPTGRSQFMFWETPAGAAPALRAWFYPGDNFGQEFTYPKHLAMLQTTQQTESSRMMKQENESKSNTETTAKQEESTVQSGEADRVAEPAPEPQVTETPKTEEQVEMAQNNPPPAPEAAPQPAPTQLPKTSSPYPWIGLAGMFALVLYGLLRVKRLA